jgi:hypothetical protein
VVSPQVGCTETGRRVEPGNALIGGLYPDEQVEKRMKMFKVYDADEMDHQLVLAKTSFQAAQIARTVWAEAGDPCHHVKVVELVLPEAGVGLIYEPIKRPVEYPKSNRRRG